MSKIWCNERVEMCLLCELPISSFQTLVFRTKQLSGRLLRSIQVSLGSTASLLFWYIVLTSQRMQDPREGRECLNLYPGNSCLARHCICGLLKMQKAALKCPWDHVGQKNITSRKATSVITSSNAKMAAAKSHCWRQSMHAMVQSQTAPGNEYGIKIQWIRYFV